MKIISSLSGRVIKVSLFAAVLLTLAGLQEFYFSASPSHAAGLTVNTASFGASSGTVEFTTSDIVMPSAMSSSKLEITFPTGVMLTTIDTSSASCAVKFIDIPGAPVWSQTIYFNSRSGNTISAPWSPIVKSGTIVEAAYMFAAAKHTCTFSNYTNALDVAGNAGNVTVSVKGMSTFSGSLAATSTVGGGSNPSSSSSTTSTPSTSTTSSSTTSSSPSSSSTPSSTSSTSSSSTSNSSTATHSSPDSSATTSAASKTSSNLSALEQQIADLQAAIKKKEDDAAAKAAADKAAADKAAEEAAAAEEKAAAEKIAKLRALLDAKKDTSADKPASTKPKAEAQKPATHGAPETDEVAAGEEGQGQGEEIVPFYEGVIEEGTFDADYTQMTVKQLKAAKLQLNKLKKKVQTAYKEDKEVASDEEKKDLNDQLKLINNKFKKALSTIDKQVKKAKKEEKAKKNKQS